MTFPVIRFFKCRKGPVDPYFYKHIHLLVKRIILSIWVFMGVFGNVDSQVITIEDKETGKPLDMVTLMSVSPRASVITNYEGQADISSFKKAEQIEIRLLGYKTEVKSYSQIQSQNFQLLLQQTNISLDQVVVSARRWQQSSGKVPSKVSVISPKSVEFQNPQTAADLLGISGKVYIQKSQQGGGSPMIRGFSTNRLLYAVDGVRMNTAIFRGGNLQNIINLDPFAVEKTEVLFGPGSVIYGSDAIGGVMSFQTLSPQLSLSENPLVEGKAVTRFSTANKEKTGHFDVKVGWKKWAMVTSFSTWDYDHLKQGSHGPDDYIKPIYVQRQDSVDRIITQEDPLLQIPSAYSQINLMQKIRFKPSENLDFEYGFHYSETSPYGRYDRNNRYRNGSLRYAEWYYGPQKWMMNNLSFSHKGKLSFYDQLNLRLAQQSFEESRIDRSLNKTDRTISTENVEAYSVNLDLTKYFSKRNTLFYGAEYIFNDILSAGMVKDIVTDSKNIGPSRYPNSTWSSLAVYLNDEVNVNEKLTILMGVRLNSFSLEADFTNNLSFYPFPFTTARIGKGSLTGSIGAVTRPDKQTVLSANFGTAFRSPNVDDIGKIFDSEPGSVTVPNPDLQAEYAYNVDLGIARIFGEFLKLDLSGYYTLLNNALVRRNFQLAGQDSIMYDGFLSQVQAIQNAAVARVYGVEASVELQLPAGFSFSSAINYQHGEEELDDGSTSPSRHAPPLYGLTRVNFNLEKLHLQFYSVYMAGRKFEDLPFEEKSKDEIYAKDASGNNYSPAWYTLNFKVSYDLSETFTINSGVENLTDQRYRPYSSGISAPGRNFIFSVRANF